MTGDKETEAAKASVRNALDLLLDPETLHEYYISAGMPPLEGSYAGAEARFHFDVYTQPQGNLAIWAGITQGEPENAKIVAVCRCIWNDYSNEGKAAEAEIIRRLREKEHTRWQEQEQEQE